MTNFGDPSGQRHVGGWRRDTHTADKVLTHGHTLLFYRYRYVFSSLILFYHCSTSFYVNCWWGMDDWKSYRILNASLDDTETFFIQRWIFSFLNDPKWKCQLVLIFSFYLPVFIFQKKKKTQNTKHKTLIWPGLGESLTMIRGTSCRHHPGVLWANDVLRISWKMDIWTWVHRERPVGSPLVPDVGWRWSALSRSRSEPAGRRATLRRPPCCVRLAVFGGRNPPASVLGLPPLTPSWTRKLSENVYFLWRLSKRFLKLKPFARWYSRGFVRCHGNNWFERGTWRHCMLAVPHKQKNDVCTRKTWNFEDSSLQSWWSCKRRHVHTVVFWYWVYLFLLFLKKVPKAALIKPRQLEIFNQFAHSCRSSSSHYLQPGIGPINQR